MDRTVQIAIVIKTNTGGVWIIEQLEEMRRRGHDVLVILPGGHGALQAKLSARGIRTLESPFSFKFRPSIRCMRELLRLRYLIRSLAPDVLMYHLYASTLAARLSSIGLGTRRVHMVAGPLFLESRPIRTAERFLSRLDHVIICGCKNAADIYASIGYSIGRLPVISYGIDTTHFSRAAVAGEEVEGRIRDDPGAQVAIAEVRAKARAELGILADDFLVIMVAYVYPPRAMVHQGRGIKGHDVILEAWQQFSTEHPDTRLLLIGGGHLASGRAHRQKLINRFRLDRSSSVTWLDSVDDVRRYYIAADVSVSPSLSEGHGAAVEASSMEVPSIVSDAGGLPETVNDASGWQVRKGDVGATLEALKVAYSEFADGSLQDRGHHARQLVALQFDRRSSAKLVADVVESQLIHPSLVH